MTNFITLIKSCCSAEMNDITYLLSFVILCRNVRVSILSNRLELFKMDIAL